MIQASKKKDVTNQILQRLNNQEKEEGTLPLLLQFYRELLRIQSKERNKISTPRTNTSNVVFHNRLEQGKPLIGFGELTINLASLRDLFVKVVAIYNKYPQLFGKTPEILIKSEAKRLITKKAIKAWLTGEELPATLTSNDFKPELIQTILHSTVKPLLVNYAEGLAHMVDQERWRHPYCPVCGGKPDFSFLDKERGSRWLLCSRCDTEWIFHRLGCPFCDQEQSTGDYLTDEDELYRLYTCQRCRSYLKAIDLRKTDEDILLPLERLLTLDMDRQAREIGFESR